MPIPHKRGLTKRAPDAGDSAHIPSSFTRLSLFLAGRLRRPRPSAGNANRWAVPLSILQTKMKKLLITLTLIIALTCCKLQNKGPSIFSNQICGKLCWNGIVVGKTDKQELLNIISTLPNIDQGSIITTSFNNSDNSNLFDERMSFDFYRILGDKDSRIDMMVLLNKQKVILLNFNGNLGLTFQDVSSTFGELTFASSLPTFDGGINVHFINSVYGIEITEYFDSERSSVLPDTEVYDLAFFDTSMYKKFLESTYLRAGPGFTLYPWTGYGKIKDHYWPP